jgi:hypothetical protein
VDLVDPTGDQVLADRRLVGGGEVVLDLVVGRGGDPAQDRVGVLVAGLHALEVEDRQPSELGQRAGKPRIDHRVHRRGEDRDAQLDAAEGLREIDVGRLDRFGTGSQGDVLEAVGRPDRVDLRAEDAPAGGRRWLVDPGGFGTVEQRAPPRASLTRLRVGKV